MTDHDESLEIGIAAGLDVPTAMVISEHGDEPPKPTGKGCGGILFVAMFVTLMLLVYFL